MTALRTAALLFPAALLACGTASVDSPDTPADAGVDAGSTESPPTTPRFDSVAAAKVAGLLAYFRFDETAGSTLADSTGTHSGVIYGLTPLAEGKIGGAWLRGSNPDDGAGLDLGVTNLTTFSAAFWWKPTDMSMYSPADGVGILWFNKAAKFNHTIGMSGTPTPNRLKFWSSGTSFGAVDGGANLVKDAWHHLALAVDTTSAVLYLNGVEVATMPSSPNQFTLNGMISVLNYNHYVGGNSNAHFGRGVIDDVSIWSVKLPAAEVAKLHAHGVAGLPVF